MHWLTPVVVAYGMWGTFIVVWNVTDRHTAKTMTTPTKSREQVYSLVLVAAIICLVLAPFLWIAPLDTFAPRLWRNPPVVEWPLLLVVAGGIGFSTWARLHLGRLWSAEVTHKAGHRIVETGPYRLVRHPIYTGFIVMYLGLALITANAFGLAALVLFTIGLSLKARLEEEFLVEELGAAVYTEYRSRTPMLVPALTRTQTSGPTL